jgi:hypothetical protein
MRRTFLIAILCLGLASTAIAAAELKPNTLTADEVKAGWLLLFDGETTFGWKVEGEAKVVDGELVLGGNAPASMTPTTEFTDFELITEYRVSGGLLPAAKLVIDSRPPRHGSVSTTPMGTAGSVLKLTVSEDREKSQALGLSSEVKFDAGTNKKSFIDFRITHRATQGGYRPVVRLETPAGTQLAITNMKLRPLGLKPLSNGKDLTGWKEHPGRKSKFTVTDKGELNVKDGPGDLQTDGQWADFVLQLECISHGPHLNSGIFFRCIPGEYQNGYEAQIRNQWQGDDRTKPVDYGTGAIYRRQAARKVVSGDNEWFTLTIVAQGNHLATWVNGYAVADWTDTRPPHRNPRNGCCTEKGAISIQGHDPTTNLSFRNLRLGELPAKRDSP